MYVSPPLSREDALELMAVLGLHAYAGQGYYVRDHIPGYRTVEILCTGCRVWASADLRSPQKTRNTAPPIQLPRRTYPFTKNMTPPKPSTLWSSSSASSSSYSSDNPAQHPKLPSDVHASSQLEPEWQDKIYPFWPSVGKVPNGSLRKTRKSRRWMVTPTKEGTLPWPDKVLLLFVHSGH